MNVFTTLFPNSFIEFIKRKNYFDSVRSLRFAALLLVLNFIFLETRGQVTLPHLDAMNYTVGQGLEIQTGWTLLNSGDALSIASGNLSFTNLPASTGNKLTFDGAGIDAAKLFTQQTSGTVYFSFLLNVTSLGSLNATGGYFSGFTEGATTTFGATVWTRKDGTGYNLGLNPKTTTANTVWSTTLAINTTYLVVISYQIVSGASNDLVKLWVNPVLGGTEPASTINTSNGSGTDMTNINRILIRQDANTATPFIQMDEFRIGTTWASVTPSTAPPVVTPASPTGTYGTPFSYDIVATGSPTTYSLSSGSFPPGLTLNGGPGVGSGNISGTPTAVGSFTADVTATNANGPGNTATLSFTIIKASQTISNFPSADSRTYTAALQQYSLSATGGGSANPVTYSSDNSAVASVSGSQVTINGAGVANITASQAGNQNYNAATPVLQVLTVGKASQVISFGSLIDRNDIDPNFPLTGTGGGSGNPVTYTSSATTVAQIVDIDGNIDPNGSYVDITGPGQTTITAFQAGNANYLAATPVQQVQNILNTNLQPQVITFAPLSNMTYGDAPFQLTATGGGSGNPIIYTSSAPAIAIISDVSGNADPNGSYVKIIFPGTTTITANQAGNAFYNAASAVSRSLTIDKRPLTVSGATANDKPYDGNNIATITGGNLVTVVPGDNVTFSGSATFGGVNAGTYTVTPAFVLGGTDQAKYTLTQPTFTASILQLSQAISFGALASKTFGAADYTLSAIGGGSGQPVTFTSLNNSVITISGNTAHIVGVGTAVIKASQAGTTNYSAAADVSQSQVVNQANQTITFPTILNKTTADAPFTINATSNSGLSITYSSSNISVATVSGNTVTITGPGITTITASQAGNTNYLPATTTRTFAVTAPLIAAWDFTGPGGTGVTIFAAALFNADLSSSNLITRGAGAPSSVGANSFRTTGFKNDGIALANTDYFQTTLSASAGKQISLSDIGAKFNGTTSYFATPGVTSQFAYSLDGNTFVFIASPVTSTSLLMTPVDLTVIPALQNVATGTTITIRYYATGQTNTGGWGLSSASAGDYGLTFGGTVTDITTNSINVNLKVYVQGYYSGGGLMQPVLNNEGVTAALPTETDSITVELHDPSTFELVDSKTVVLLIDGNATASFTQPAGSYYIAVKHRNAIQTWTALPVTCSATTDLYDFSSAANKAFGDNQVYIGDNLWAIYTGDLNQDEYIDAFDYSGYNDDNLAGINGIYIATDMNGDGYVDAFDYSQYNDNNLAGIMSIHP